MYRPTLSELWTMNLVFLLYYSYFYFLLLLFFILDLDKGYSMILYMTNISHKVWWIHDTCYKVVTYVTVTDHTIIWHRKGYRRFWYR